MTINNVPFNNLAPYLTLTEGIVLNGIFPSRDGGDSGNTPVGAIRSFAFNYVPGGHLTASGQTLSVSQNTALFSILGTQYGGNGSSNFVLPDLTGRVSLGSGEDGYVGEARGSTLTTLTRSEIPTGRGGGGQLVDNTQPELTITYGIRVNGLYPSSGSNGAPGGLIGEIVQFAGNFTPSNGGAYLPADGRTVNINEYENLYTLIGTTYGGDGQTTFALPDLKGRNIVGSGAVSIDGSPYTVGQKFGDSQIALSNANLPATVGGQGQPFSNEQPSLVLTYAIATTGIFPLRESGGGADADGDPYVGEVRAFALRPDQLPRGWHVADGATFQISQNQVLFSLLGTQYGGNGQTTFRLPDLQGRAVVSAGTSSDGGQTFTVGQSGGSRLVYLSDTQTPNFIAPVNTVPGAVNADLRDTVTFGSVQGTQISVQDGDNSTLSVSLSVLHGTLTLIDPTGISASGNGTTQLVLSGSTAAINTKLDGLVYRSTPGYAGQDTLTVRSTDSQLVDVDNVAITAQAAVPTVRGLISAATGPTNTSDLTYTLTFSENVSGVDPADFVLRRTDGTALSNVPASATSADGGTNWTVNIPVVDVEGTVHLELKASGTGITDSDGNPLPQGAIVGTSVTLDHLVPVVTGIVPITVGPTNAASLTQTVTFSEAVTGVDQSDFVLTQTGFATGAISAVTGSGTTYTVTINNLSGTGTLRLDLTGNGTGIVDAAGNAAPAYAAGTTVIVDRDAPSAPILASPANGSLTNNARPTVSGTAEANSSVAISIDGTAVGSTTASGAGAFSFVTPNALADGAHSFKAEATDAAGNVSPAATRDIVVDATAPVAEVISVAFSADSGSSSTDRITNVAAQTISGSLTGSLGAGEGVWVSLDDGGTYTLATADGTGSWSLTNQTLVGSNTLRAKVIDGAGNAGPEYSVAYVLDTTAPTTTIGGIAFSADTGVSTTDLITRVAAQTVSATLSAALAAGDSLYASANGGGNWTDITSRVSGTSVSWSGVTLATGSNELRFRVVDVAGNEGPTASRLYTLDTVAPTLTITSNVSQLKANESAAITFTFSEDPGTAFTVADVTVSGGTLSPLTGSGSVRVATFTPSVDTDNGIASVTVAAGSYADGAGNPGGAGSSPSITFDTLRPAASSAPMLAVGSDTGLSSTDGLTANNRPTITGSAEAGALVTLYDTDGTTVVGTGASVGGTYSITPSTALVDGEHQLTTKVTDAAGNVSAASAPLSITIDTRAPTLAITSSASSLRIGETATLTFAFSEDPGATFTWDGSVGDVVVSGGTLSALSGAGRTRTAVFTPTAGVSAGTASITVPAGSYVDAAGNLGSAGATPSLTFNTVVPPSDDGSPPTTAPGSQAGGQSTSLTTTTDPVAAQAAASQAVQGLPASVDRTTAGQGIAAFLAGLPAGTSVNVSTFTPTSGASDIRIDGPTNGTQTIVILDASAVPPGTPITLNNVGFVILSGPASLVGGDGSQVVFGDNGAQSMVLGADDDTLHGGGGNDVVGSKGGNDQLYGDAGNDTVFGGIGNDTLFGGTDQDIVYGNQDADLIYGNQGQDTLYGGQGDDRAYGGQGDDRMFGNAGNDMLYGNIGSDIVYGNQGADIIYGNQGNDALFGGQGDDILYGGQGDDVLVGGLGNNTLIGGLGADRYVFGANPGGRDLILGFNQAEGDRIALGGQTYTVNSAQNGDALLTLSGGGTVGLAGIRAEQVNASYFAA